ncbi:hypothetical protein LTR62_008464 [Meristemomyces frigidus]|uniref:CID domain-containing protein n=1 Tax=Meristemomyces frigidus TaxID=1508187 RepID=A0AAN7TMN0_9PEZI|nr:hypothetical protein LTR62_008464 [Meristemomyces frigidus]
MELRGIRNHFVDALEQRGGPVDPRRPPPDAEAFLQNVFLAANICTRRNIQQCSAFILQHVLPSTERTELLCRLLFAIGKSFSPREPGKRVDTTKNEPVYTGLGKIVNGKVQQSPQPHFQRLQVLYILSDVLMTHRHRSADSRSPNAESISIIKRYLPLLASLAVFRGTEKFTRSNPHLLSLLKIWHDNDIVPELTIVQIHTKILSSDTNNLPWTTLLARLNGEEAEITQLLAREAEEANLTLPRRHGVTHDPTAPWHELPAANGLYMKRLRGYPLKAAAFPAGGYEVQGSGAPLPSDLKSDVQALHREMLLQFTKYTNPAEVQDIDALGNVIYKDHSRPTRNYWGWSLEGLPKMKEQREMDEANARGYADLGLGGGRMDSVGRARELAASGGGRPGVGQGFVGTGWVDRGGGGGGRGGRGGRGWQGRGGGRGGRR